MTDRQQTVLMVVVLLLLGILNNVAFGMISVPDEAIHYSATFHLFGNIDPSVEAIGVGYPTYGYLPAAIALEIGRGLGLTGTSLHVLARMSNYVVFLLVMVLSGKVAPDLRMAVLAFAALPATVWQAASYSYDSWTMTFSMLFICYMWRLTGDSKRVGIKELVLYTVLLLTFAPIKYIYVLLGLLILAIPRSRWQNLKGILLGTMVAIVGFMVAMWSRLQETLGYLFTTNTDTRGLGQGLSGDPYTVSYVLRHPFLVLLTFVKTFFNDTESMIQRLLAGEWYSDCVPEYLTVLLAVLFIGLLMMATRESLSARNRMDRPLWTVWVYRCTFVLGVLAVYVSFLFVYSYYNEGQIGVISGVQGRYFLPLVVLLAPAGSARLSVHCCAWLDQHKITGEQLWSMLVYVGVLVTLCRMVGFVA